MIARGTGAVSGSPAFYALPGVGISYPASAGSDQGLPSTSSSPAMMGGSLGGNDVVSSPSLSSPIFTIQPPYPRPSGPTPIAPRHGGSYLRNNNSGGAAGPDGGNSRKGRGRGREMLLHPPQQQPLTPSSSSSSSSSSRGGMGQAFGGGGNGGGGNDDPYFHQARSSSMSFADPQHQPWGGNNIGEDAAALFGLQRQAGVGGGGGGGGDFVGGSVGARPPLHYQGGRGAGSSSGVR